MAGYQEPSDKTGGARVFCLVRGPRSTYRPPSLPVRLINWHRDARPADHGGPAAFNETSILEYDPPSRKPREARGKIN